MTEPELSLEVYAAVLAAISAGQPREQALAAHGLSEEAFGEIERSIEAEFSKAMNHPGDDVPPFFQKYEAAIREAQLKALGTGHPTLEQFARGVAALQRPGDPLHALERLGMNTQDLLRALGHWGTRIAKDPELAKQFEAIRTGKKR